MGKGQNEQQEATAGPQVNCGDVPASCSQVRGARTRAPGAWGDQRRSGATSERAGHLKIRAGIAQVGCTFLGFGDGAALLGVPRANKRRTVLFQGSWEELPNRINQATMIVTVHA